MKSDNHPARKRILARIEAALRTPAPGPLAGGEPQPAFSPIENPLERFRQECALNQTECMIVPDQEHGSMAVAQIVAGLPPGPIFLEDTPFLRSVASCFAGDRPLRWSSEGAPRENSQATVTGAECLVAATGSVLVSAARGGRGGSVVAPVHIVIAGVHQLLPDLNSTLAQAMKSGTVAASSFLCLITGSSRTGDIEKILVLGAHGPKRLIVVLSLQA